MEKRYAISIHWSSEDEGFIATCREFPNVSAFGETYEEASREMSVALDAAMEACLKLGKKLPEPIADIAFPAGGAASVAATA